MPFDLLATPSGHATRRQSRLAEPSRGVVRAQRKPIFGAGSHHPVRLADALECQIVDHDADVRRPTVEAHLLKIERNGRCVEAGGQTLGSSLLIARRAVDLAGEEQARDSRTSSVWLSRRGSTNSYSTA